VSKHVAIILILVPILSCASTISSSPPDGLGSSPTIGTRSARESVAEGRTLVERGEYVVAIPRLLQVLSKYDNNQASAEARYWLGQAYYHTESHRDAITMFESYLEAAPEGKYAAEAREFITLVQEEYDRKYLAPDELDNMIAEARASVEAQPDDLDEKLRLAHLLWIRGDYEMAGRFYETIVRANPEYMQQSEVANRIEFTPEGEAVVMSPAEVKRRSIEAQPIQIHHVNSFRSGEDLFTREDLYYVVTGRATNRSDSVLYGVQVHVTILGHGNVVFDTATVNLNRMNPGETRAFSVRFGTFDVIENIMDYETVATFGR